MYSAKCATVLFPVRRHQIPDASFKFAKEGIPPVRTIPDGCPPLLLHRPHQEEVMKIMKESIQRNHGKGSHEDKYPIAITLELSRQLEKFYSLEIVRTPPPAAPLPMTVVTPEGKSEPMNFYVVQREDMIALEQAYDILAEIFRIVFLYELKEPIMTEVAKTSMVLTTFKPMTETIQDCLNYLDIIEKDFNADICSTLLKTILLLKMGLFSWWPTVGILDVGQQWDKVISEIVTEIEKEQEQPMLPLPFEVDIVHHSCSFVNPVVEMGDFNADEVREALSATFEKFVNDPNTVFV